MADGPTDEQFYDEFNADAEKAERLNQVNHAVSACLIKLAEAVIAGELEAAAARPQFVEALEATMAEQDVTAQDMCALPDDHPLKDLFFSGYDREMFADALARFTEQVQRREALPDGKGDWDAEAAEGEGDEDHTLE